MEAVATMMTRESSKFFPSSRVLEFVLYNSMHTGIGHVYEYPRQLARLPVHMHV